MSIPCKYKDGSGVSPADADAIMRALGFASAMHAEDVIGAAEKRRKERKQAKAAAHDAGIAGIGRPVMTP